MQHNNDPALNESSGDVQSGPSGSARRWATLSGTIHPLSWLLSNKSTTKRALCLSVMHTVVFDGDVGLNGRHWSSDSKLIFQDF